MDFLEMKFKVGGILVMLMVLIIVIIIRMGVCFYMGGRW